MPGYQVATQTKYTMPVIDGKSATSTAVVRLLAAAHNLIRNASADTNRRPQSQEEE
jgi:hypothetical protein